MSDHVLTISDCQILTVHVRKFTFSQRVIEDWNKLPTFIIESADVLTFKTKLDCLWNSDRFHYI